MYQSSLTGQKLREQEEALRKELLPQAKVLVKQVRDTVRQEELAGVWKTPSWIVCFSKTKITWFRRSFN